MIKTKSWLMWGGLSALLLINASQTVSAAGDDSQQTVATKVSELKGIDLSKLSTYMSDTLPGTVEDEQAQQKLFMIYNVGQQKFLNMGGWWGTKPVLSSVPRLFWMQNHTATKGSTTKVANYYTYPAAEGDELTISPLYVMQEYNGGNLQLGNPTWGGYGANESTATYNYIKVTKNGERRNQYV